MIKYPTVILDDFYENPEAIRSFALGLDFYSGTNFPGKRTKSLHEINKELNQFCVNKFMNLFYDFDSHYVNWWCDVRFQLIEPYDKNQESVLNKSFIHKDNDCILAGLIYLTPDADLNSGTSMFNKKINAEIDTDNLVRMDYYSNGSKEDLFKEHLLENHKSFYETLNVKNIYNRVVAYDSNIFHTSSCLHAGKEPRLTQVFFISKVDTTGRPIAERVRNYPN
jgi:hypothetical protein